MVVYTKSNVFSDNEKMSVRLTVKNQFLLRTVYIFQKNTPERQFFLNNWSKYTQKMFHLNWSSESLDEMVNGKGHVECRQSMKTQ